MDLAVVVTVLGKDALSGVVDGAIGKLHELEGVAGKADHALRAAVGGSTLLAGGLAGLVGGAAAAGAAGIKLASDLEQARIGFTTMLGDGEKADTFLKDLAKFAAETPFELKNLVPASEKLLAFGFDAQKVIPMLTAVGNAASAMGSGQVGIDRITLALGQMQAKGKVSGDEMLQLAEAGIPAWQMLADKIGVTVPEAMKLGEKGAIDSKTAIDALIDGMNAKFPNMMQAQSQTLAGLWSTVEDNASQALTVVGNELIKTFDLKPKLQGAIETLGTLSKLLQDEGLVGALGKIFPPESRTVITAVAGAIAVGLVPALYAATAGFLALMAPLVPFLAAGAALGLLAKEIADNWEPLGDLFTAAGGWLESLGSIAQTAMTGDFAGAMDGARDLLVSDVFPAISATLSQAGQELVSWVTDNGPQLLEELGTLLGNVVTWLGTGAVQLVTGLAEWAGAFLGWVGPMIPDLLRGLGGLLLSLVDWIANTALPSIVSHLVEWGGAFIGWIGPNIVPMLLELGKLDLELGAWILTTALPGIVAKLAEWGKAFLDWVGDSVLPNLASTLGTISSAIGTWITGTAVPFLLEQAKRLGGAIIDGILSGLVPGPLYAKMKEIAGAAVGAGANAIEAHSPSQLAMRQIGEPLGLGIIAGLERTAPQIIASVQRTISQGTGAADALIQQWTQSQSKYTTGGLRAPSPAGPDFTNNPAATDLLTKNGFLTTGAAAAPNFGPNAAAAGLVQQYQLLSGASGGAVGPQKDLKDAVVQTSTAMDHAGQSTKEHRTALDGYHQGLLDLVTDRRWREQFGDLGAQAMADLSEAMETKSFGAGSKAANALQRIIDAARKKGIPGWAQLGTDLMAAYEEALTTGSEAAKQRVADLLALAKQALDAAETVKAAAASANNAYGGGTGGTGENKSVYHFQQNAPTLPSLGIKAMAAGGLVDRPTLALIGEAGPELVMPLPHFSGGYGAGGGGIDYDRLAATLAGHMSNLTVQVDGSTFGRVTRTQDRKYRQTMGNLRDGVGGLF